MADFFLDVSAVGNEYQAYADTPTSWGVPQDGNGKAASAASAAVAVATIDVAGCTASGTGTIGVFGVTASSTLNASGSALATAIAAAINAATGAVTSTYSALLLPLNRLVYARVNPVTNTQVDIMLRIAGTDWNAMTPTQANISPAATITSFTGGVNGPFGYWCAQGAVFGKAALKGYGIFIQKSAGVSDPTATDPIYIRTARSGSNVTSAYTINTNDQTSMVAPRTFVTDHGSKWSGDDGVFIWDMYQNNNGYWETRSSYALNILGGKQGGFKIKWRHSNGAYALSLFTVNSNLNVSNLDLECYDSVSKAYLSHGTSGTFKANYTNCRFYVVGSQSLLIHGGNGYSNTEVNFVNCLVSWTSAGTNIGSFVSTNGGANGRKTSFVGCEFVVDGGVYTVTGVLASPSLYFAGAAYGNMLSVIDCKGVSNIGATIATATTDFGSYFLFDDSKSGKGYRYTCTQYSSDWMDDGTFPTLNSQTQNGSYIASRIQWRNGAFGTFPLMQPVRVGKYNTFYKGAQGTKKIILELLTPTAEVPTTYDVFAVVKYVDKDSIVRVESTMGLIKDHVAGTLASLASSSASWTTNGVSGVEARKIEIAATAYQVKSNSEVSVELFFGDGPSTDRYIYVNPEIAIS